MILGDLKWTGLRILILVNLHVFTILRFWCSGRICCEGMLVELRLLKRQDLVGVISNLMKPAHDQIHVRVDMSPEDMDSFIFCIASKKSSLRYVLTIKSFCLPEKCDPESLVPTICLQYALNAL